jgi:hypothetical protein
MTEPRQYHLRCQLPHSRSVSWTAQSHHICFRLRAGTAPSFFRAPSAPRENRSHRRAPDKGSGWEFYDIESWSQMRLCICRSETGQPKVSISRLGVP